jgi:dihydrofolate synthase/folylpolyglutamate synthase
MSSDPPLPSSAVLAYEEAIAFLFSLEKIGIKFGLDNIRFLLQKLGNPQQTYPSIHIAGTNGKGSTAQFITSILIASGYRVGTYTSPHLIDFCERIQIDAAPVSKEMIAEGISLIRHHITADMISEQQQQFLPTYFEVSTALAFWCFAQSGIDIAIVETGMGGRLDATNVLDPIISVITNIALEHQEYLGDTLQEIAAEKAGIIKHGRPLVLGEREPDQIHFFQRLCQQKQAEFYPVTGKLEIKNEQKDGVCFHIRGKDKHYNDLKISLLGHFQAENAHLAVRVWEVLNRLGWEIPLENMRAGLQSAKWPGRMHLLQEKPLVVADGAHNPQAAALLMKNIRQFFNFNRLFLIFGCMRDKDILEIINNFLTPAERIILTRSKNDRAEQPEKILHLIDPKYQAKTTVIQNTQQAVDRALAEAKIEDLLLITGSLYVVGDILPMFGYDCHDTFIDEDIRRRS